jgi:hypothetical protein
MVRGVQEKKGQATEGIYKRPNHLHWSEIEPWSTGTTKALKLAAFAFLFP